MPTSELIAVTGMVGLGKTTLTRALARHYGCQAFLEPVGDENPWLARCYASPEGRRTNWLPAQLAFIMRQLDDQDLLQQIGGRAITDQLLEITPQVYWQQARADGSVDKADIQLAERAYAHAIANRPRVTPSLVIQLSAPDTVALSRIKARGRENEDKTAPQWWLDLSARHAAFHAGYTAAPTMTLDVRDYDVEDAASLRTVAEHIETVLGTMQSVKPAVERSVTRRTPLTP